MTPLTRVLRPVSLPAAAAAAAAMLAVALTAGCQSSTSSSVSSSSSSSSAAASSAPASTASSAVTASAASTASAAASAIGTGGINPAGPMRPAGDAVYFAEGGDVRGTTEHEPSCSADCALSGDSTALLSTMTWSTWTGARAVGTGTEKIDDCTPNCAVGKLYAVKVTVTFTKPIHVCVDGTSHWYWSQASFTWPDGLPAPFKGANAPINPLVYSQIASQSKSCA